MSSEATVCAFIAAWSRLDADEIFSYLDEAIVYHNVPIEPLHGRMAVERALRPFIARFTSAD